MASDELVSFGDLLRRKRRAAGLTHEELAERAGLSVRGISDLERGVVRAPRRDTLELLADALDLPDEERQTWEALRRKASTRGSRPNSHTRSRELPAGNLPTPLTSLIGRERETRDVVAKLRAGDGRLVSVTGPGGVGKTRLAIEVSRQLQGTLPDGAWFVDLAPLSSSELVLAALASTLGITVTGAQPPLAALIEALRQSQRLLILDNFEHVLDSAPAIARLLSECPSLLMLTTSRVALRVHGEREYPLAPLALPEASIAAGTSVHAEVESVALFVQRAQAVRPEFSITEDNARAVVEICRRLDGLPLALELAAARIRVMPAQAMLDRMEPLLPLLTGGARDLPDRQRTLRATIEWSYELLDPEVRSLLRLLSVFRGGWTLEAAEAVVGPSIDVLNGLQVLMEHSLVRGAGQPDGAVRYTMLETVREFGQEYLLGLGERDRAHERHAAFYADYVERAAALLTGPEQRDWYERLRRDYPNVQAAFEWSVEHDDALTAVRLAVGLRDFWFWYGRLREGRRWLEAVLALSEDVPARLRAQVYRSLGVMLGREGDPITAARFVTEAIAHYRASGDLTGLAEMLQVAGGLEMFRGDYARATSFHEESLRIARVANNTDASAYALGALSLMASIAGDFPRAEVLASQSLRGYQELRDESGITKILGYQAYFALWKNELERATEVAGECMARALALGDVQWRVFALELLGYIALELEEFHRSYELFCESLRGQHELRTMMVIAQCLEGIAGAVCGLKFAARAATLLGYAETLRQEIHSPLPPPRRPRYDRTVAACRAQLDPQEFKAAWNRGRQLTLDQAVSLALEACGEGPEAETMSHQL